MKKKTNLFFSEAHIEIPEDYDKLSQKKKYPLLGELLKEAGIITEQQIQVALQEQKEGYDLRIGEILQLHGWIASKTASFFADQWFNFLETSSYHPIGYYFQQAALLNEKQIERILSEQKRLNYRFGEIAILDGLLQEKTVNFFVNHLQETSVLKAKLFTPNKIILSSDAFQKVPSSLKVKETIDIPWID